MGQWLAWQVLTVEVVAEAMDAGETGRVVMAPIYGAPNICLILWFTH